MKADELHYKQITTKYKEIKNQLETFSLELPIIIIKCIVSQDNALFLTTASIYLEMLSRYVYLGKDNRYKKSNTKIYKKILFEYYAETVSEVKALGEKTYGESFEATKTHKMLWQIADVVCPMMACVSEQATVSEYAYAIKYVIENTENLPKPEFALLFPKNYENYNYSEYELDILKM